MNNSAATYTNTPNPIAINRIIFDRKNIEKDYDYLDSEGIYFNWDNKNSVDTHYRNLIIGPSDSPYEGGFYFFQAQYPDNYPFYPMKMKTMTQGGNVRKHPNLYTCGKCCFSFLGTWSGPPWTACQNPKTVAISIRSVLTPNPIENEPGWEKSTDERTKKYAQIIKYFNIRHAVIDMMKTPPSGFESFLPIMKKQFIKNYSKYLANLEEFKSLDGTTMQSPAYGFHIKIDYSKCYQSLCSLYEDIVSSDISLLSIVDKKQEEKKPIVPEHTSSLNSSSSSSSSSSLVSSSLSHSLVSKTPIKQESINNTPIVNSTSIAEDDDNKKGKKVPNKLASSFDVGYTMVSENDGCEYKVGMVNAKNNVSYKKWFKLNKK